MAGGVPIDGVDHVIVAVRSLAAAERRYRNLGFRLTPQGGHPALGSVNHTFVFHDGTYGELLATERDSPFTDYYRRFAEAGEGLAGLALRTRDARAAREALAAAGFQPDAVLDFERPVPTDEGFKEAQFSIVQLPPEALAGVRVFLCEHRTPELVWLPHMLDHPNGVLGLRSVMLLAHDPGPVVLEYERLTGMEAVRREFGFKLDVGRTMIEFMQPAAFTAMHGDDPVVQYPLPRLAGLCFETADLNRAAAFFAVQGIRFSEQEGTLQVASTDAFGVRLVFT